MLNYHKLILAMLTFALAAPAVMAADDPDLYDTGSQLVEELKSNSREATALSITAEQLAGQVNTMAIVGSGMQASATLDRASVEGALCFAKSDLSELFYRGGVVRATDPDPAKGLLLVDQTRWRALESEPTLQRALAYYGYAQFLGLNRQQMNAGIRSLLLAGHYACPTSARGELSARTSASSPK